MYLRARYYHPALGVFPSLDPVENLNRYQYVGADPTNKVDPSGLQGGTGTLLGSCAALVASPLDFVVGDLGCVAIIAGLVLAGVIDWQEVAEAGEELATRVSKALEGISIPDVVRPEALPNTATPPWIPTVVITPAPTAVPVAPTVTPAPVQDRDPDPVPTAPPPPPLPLPTAANPTSCPTTTATPTGTPTRTPRPDNREFVGYHGTSSIHVPSILAGIHGQGRGQLGTGFYVYPVEPKPDPRMTNTDEQAYAAAMQEARDASMIGFGSASVLCIYAENYSQMTWRYVPAENPDGGYYWWTGIPYNFLTDYEYLVSELDFNPDLWQVKFNPSATGALEAEECDGTAS